MSPLVDWFAEDFGGTVHVSSTGSWVPDAHTATEAVGE